MAGATNCFWGFLAALQIAAPCACSRFVARGAGTTHEMSAILVDVGWIMALNMSSVSDGSVQVS